MTYAMTAVTALVAGLTAQLIAWGAVAGFDRAVSCYEVGHRGNIDTSWNPISGCTIGFLGARIEVER